MAKYDRIKAKLINEPWLIEQDWLETLVSIVEIGGDFEALQARKLQKLEMTTAATVKGDVAIVPLNGPIYPKANLMTDMSGATSLEQFAQDYQVAVDNPDVKKIVLDIDSPGGVVTGIAEMAALIKSSGKETISFVRGSGASAAYWIGSASAEMVLSPTAMVGSIGVVTAYRKRSGDDNVIEFVNSASPNKRLDPESKKGEDAIIEQLNDLAEVFIADVALNRGVSESVVTEKFGKGGVLVGQKAVAAGMADRIGTLDSLLTELTSKNGETNMDLKTLRADHNEVYEAAVKIGHDTATEESREINTSLKSQVVTLTEENTAQATTIAASADRVKQLEKEKAIQSENDKAAMATANASKADGIVETQLSASTIPENLHAKVAGFIDHGDHVSEGKLDVAAFTAAVDAEIADWAGSFTPSVQGTSNPGRESDLNNSADSKASDVVVDRLFAHTNQPTT